MRRIDDEIGSIIAGTTARIFRDLCNPQTINSAEVSFEDGYDVLHRAPI